MKYNKNILAFICLHTSWWNIYPPQDVATEIRKELIYDKWKKYLENDYKNHKRVWFYLHTPFCEAKCVFCSCWSKKILWWNTLENYLLKIKKEIKYFSPLFKDIKLNHAYFWWWTPSIYTDKQLEDLLKTIKNNYNFESNAQFNFEISPRTITEEKIRILKKYWVSRITIWIQTMTKKSLEFNNRFQTWGKIIKTFKWTRQYGIENINVDLMPWIPWENLEFFLLNLKKIINLWPDMIHLYPFRPSEETLFSKKWYTYNNKDIKNRDLMYELWIKLIEKYWYYGVKNDSWGKKESARNEQEVDKIVNNCSILGFWYPTRSYIHKNLMYFTWYNMYKDDEPIYMWIELTKKDYMIRYIISHFRSWFNLKDFKKEFGVEFKEVFKEEIKFLFQNWVLNIKDNYLYSNINNVFEKLLYSKVFYDEKYVKFLLEKNNFDSNINYISKFKNILSVHYK